MRFENLRERLLAGGIAPRHVRRYLTELDEHLDELTTQQRQAGYDGEDAAIRARALLGEDSELAAAMLEQKTLRAISARAPWAMFLLLPPPLAIAAGFALIAPMVLIANLAHMTSPHGIFAPLWFRQMASAVTLLGNLGLAPLLAAAFVLLASRQRMAWVWPLLAVVLLASMDLHFSADFPPLGHRGGSLSIGAMPVWQLVHEPGVNYTSPLATLRLALTLLPVLYLCWTRKRAL